MLSLKSSLNEWNDQIIKQSMRKINRSKHLCDLKESSFYTPRAAKPLSNYYLELIQK